MRISPFTSLNTHALALGCALLLAIAPCDASEIRSSTMSHRAEGPFDVTMTPQSESKTEDGLILGRFQLDKRFHGALDATSRGEMLTAMTAVKGSAGYVAIERVEGTLDGKRGSFVLQHSGLMSGSERRLTLVVVPDSGSAELAGLSGEMQIRIEEGGKHFYVFDYRLPDGE